MNNKLLDEFYDRLRDHIKHEDNLINQRLSWFLGFQGLFVVSFGTVLEKGNQEPTKLVLLVLIIICVIGYLTCIPSIINVSSAVRSISELNKQWISMYRDDNDSNIRYPHLYYEDNSIISRLSHHYSYQFIMMIAWTILLAFVIYKYSTSLKWIDLRLGLIILVFVPIILVSTLIICLLCLYVFKYHEKKHKWKNK